MQGITQAIDSGDGVFIGGKHLHYNFKPMTTSTTSFFNESIDQEIDLASLSQMQGAGVLEWIGDKAEKTVAFYSGWAGAVAGGASLDKGAYDAGVNAGIISSGSSGGSTQVWAGPDGEGDCTDRPGF